MKKLFVLFASVAVALAAASCGPLTYTPSDVDIASISEYAFIEPVADILYYDSKNKPVYDYELSDEAADLVASIISSQRYPFSEMVEMDYDDEDRNVRKWIQNLGDISTSRLERVRVPEDLRKAIEETGYRYGIVIYSNGYIRSREAIRYEERQEAIGNAIGLAIDAIANASKKKSDEDSGSTYHYTTSPEDKTPYDTNLYCVVIDSQEDRIIHYVHPLPFLENDPLNGRDMESMLTRLLKEFYK